MPKQIPEEEFSKIIDLVASNSKGISLAELHAKLKLTIDKRKLHHRLLLLIRQGKIGYTGNNRGRVYTALHQEKNEGIIPLSHQSLLAKKKLQKPVLQRKPVSYNYSFLNDYRPNETFYLSNELRREFSELAVTNGERPAGTYAREILNRLLIDLAWNSSRLEGNTYTLLETERLLDFSSYAEGKDIQEAQMILNHKEAIEFLVDSADQIGIDSYTVLNLHALLSQNLLKDETACGKIREKGIGIGKSTYEPLAIPSLIKEYFQQILDTAKAIKDPFEQSFFLMVHLPYLQPFEDVNKRVSRLAANIPLIKSNLCPLSFIDVPRDDYISGLLAIYELNEIDLFRDVYVWAYKRSCERYSSARKTLGEPDPFRIQYRAPIYETVVAVVTKKLTMVNAISYLKDVANETIPEKDRERFIEVVERELRALHEGNIARYRIKRFEFNEWYSIWSK